MSDEKKPYHNAIVKVDPTKPVAAVVHVIPVGSALGRLMTEHYRSIFRQHEEEDKRWEEIFRKKKERREKIASALGGTAGELYAVLKELMEGATFRGGSGPASMSMDREDWRDLKARIDKLEGEVEKQEA